MQKIRDWFTLPDLKSLDSFLEFCLFYSSLIIKLSIRTFHMLEFRKMFATKSALSYGQKNVIENSQGWKVVFLRHPAALSQSSHITQMKQPPLSWLWPTLLLEWVPLFLRYNKARKSFLNALEENALILKVHIDLLRANYVTQYIAFINSKTY